MVTIIEHSGGSSSLAGACRSGTENHKSSGDNRGSEVENIYLEPVGTCVYDGGGWSVVGGGDTVMRRRHVGCVVVVGGKVVVFFKFGERV
ncbi:unnamed protein product [Lactuca virosa]|uniref:Uncharacterized protein n=1 Tax=Lactuca virosa TaxID=75947 RepID=A0AAU9LSP8_9ASTR|nr:unnamed protein product [Lactuca virosa]